MIAIIDADFAHAACEGPDHDDVFITDYHDAEMMMLCSDAVTAVLREHCSHDKHRTWEQKFGESVVHRLIREAAKTGWLLWFSCVNGMNLNFDELKTASFMDQQTLEIDLNRLVRHVKDRSCRQDITDGFLVDGLNAMRKRSSDPRQVSRGHDVVAYLAFAIQSAIGSCTKSRTNPEIIEAFLRVAYGLQYFSTTSLYGAVIQWERQHPPYEVFLNASVSGARTT